MVVTEALPAATRAPATGAASHWHWRPPETHSRPAQPAHLRSDRYTLAAGSASTAGAPQAGQPSCSPAASSWVWAGPPDSMSSTTYLKEGRTGRAGVDGSSGNGYRNKHNCTVTQQQRPQQAQCAGPASAWPGPGLCAASCSTHRFHLALLEASAAPQPAQQLLHSRAGRQVKLAGQGDIKESLAAAAASAARSALRKASHCSDVHNNQTCMSMSTRAGPQASPTALALGVEATSLRDRDRKRAEGEQAKSHGFCSGSLPPRRMDTGQSVHALAWHGKDRQAACTSQNMHCRQGKQQISRNVLQAKTPAAPEQVSPAAGLPHEADAGAVQLVPHPHALQAQQRDEGRRGVGSDASRAAEQPVAADARNLWPETTGSHLQGLLQRGPGLLSCALGC